MANSPHVLPTSAGCTLQDAGHTWDAIRVPRSVGLAAVGILATGCGAVVDAPGEALYFFVATGAAEEWRAENTRVLSLGSTVTIPPVRRTVGPGPHWRVCPGEDGWLTDASALEAAIGDAFGPRLGAEHFG